MKFKEHVETRKQRRASRQGERKSSSSSWKAYARKEKESCNAQLRSPSASALRSTSVYFTVAQKERCFLDRVYLEA